MGARSSQLRVLVAGIAVAGFAAACAEPPSGPAAPAAAAGPVFENTTPPPAGARVTVCKIGSSATFSVAATGGREGTLLAGAAFGLADGECKDVWEAAPNPLQPDPASIVDVAETGLLGGIQFDSVTVNVPDPGQLITISGDSVSVYVNFYHPAVITFFNSVTPPPPPPPGGGEGCTPGFWKQRQHFDSWTAPYTTGTLFSAVFEDAFPGMTLLEVLSQGGGGLNALGRHTVAALLNSASGDVSYDFAMPQGVIDAFNAVFPGGDYNGLKSIFEGFNEQGCPL